MTIPLNPNKFNQIRGTDSTSVLDDGNTYTSSGQAQVSSADKEIDWGTLENGRPDIIRIFGNLTSSDNAANYIKLQFSDTDAFTVVQYEHVLVADTADAGQFDFVTIIGDRYMRLYYDLTGTSLIIANAYYTSL
jgi:hypothetical protein